MNSHLQAVKNSYPAVTDLEFSSHKASAATVDIQAVLQRRWTRQSSHSVFIFLIKLGLVAVVIVLESWYAHNRKLKQIKNYEMKSQCFSLLSTLDSVPEITLWRFHVLLHEFPMHRQAYPFVYIYFNIKGMVICILFLTLLFYNVSWTSFLLGTCRPTSFSFLQSFNNYLVSIRLCSFITYEVNVSSVPGTVLA